jgi:hypothetical protein
MNQALVDQIVQPVTSGADPRAGNTLPKGDHP